MSSGSAIGLCHLVVSYFGGPTVPTKASCLVGTVVVPSWVSLKNLSGVLEGLWRDFVHFSEVVSLEGLAALLGHFEVFLGTKAPKKSPTPLLVFGFSFGS